MAFDMMAALQQIDDVSRVAGLVFPVGRVSRYLHDGHYAETIDLEAPIFLTAVMEYMSWEIFDLILSLNESCENIVPSDIQNGLKKDEELNKLFGEVLIQCQQPEALPDLHALSVKSQEGQQVQKPEEEGDAAAGKNDELPYSKYISMVLTKVRPTGVGISTEALSIMNAFAEDILKKIATEAGRLNKKKMTDEEITTAVRQVLPGEIAKFSVSEGIKAVVMHSSSR